MRPFQNEVASKSRTQTGNLAERCPPVPMQIQYITHYYWQLLMKHTCRHTGIAGLWTRKSAQLMRGADCRSDRRSLQYVNMRPQD
jgi:hypothetical protein